MLGSDINIFYYSGTGNTLLIVNEMIKTFSEKGIHVNRYQIEYTDPRKIDTGKTFGLAFPVAFQSTFPFIWNFINELPQVNGTRVFMIDTMKAFSGAIVGPLKKVLTSKGYTCIGACEIVMPNNWFPKKTDDEKNREKISAGLEKAGRYAEELIEGKATWNRIPFLSKGLYNICGNDFMIKRINLAVGRKIAVDKEKCLKCGLCVKLCPVNNIEMKEYPVWHDLCEVCVRCLSFCPVNAVFIPGKELKRYRAVKAQELLRENAEVSQG